MDGSWLQLKLKRRRLQRRLHAHLTLLHVYYPWNQIKSILLLNIRIIKQTNPNRNVTESQYQRVFAALEYHADVFEPQPYTLTLTLREDGRLAGHIYIYYTILYYAILYYTILPYIVLYR